MKHFFLALSLGALLLPTTIFAQQPASDSAEATILTAEIERLESILVEATASAEEATASTSLASPSAEVVEKIQRKENEDLTVTTGEQKSKLARFLDENPIGPLSWNNFLQHAMRQAVEQGLPANTVVLILLFPVITSIIAFSKHIVGLKGFGLYIPAVLSVAFVSTGVVSGVLMFATLLFASILMRNVVKRLRMPYLARTAMLLWGVSLITLILLIGGAYAGLIEFLTVNIFPLLIIMLLMENFMESQLFSKQATAIRLTLETLFIAIFCSLVIGQELVQEFVLLNTEFVLIVVLIVNWLIGRYTGLRILERLRFRNILEQQ